MEYLSVQAVIIVRFRHSEDFDVCKTDRRLEIVSVRRKNFLWSLYSAIFNQYALTYKPQ